MDWKNFIKSLTLENLIPSILLTAAGVLVIRLLMKLFDKALERSRLQRTANSMLRSGMKLLLYFLLGLMVCSQLGVDVSSLVALLSVVSLAISLAVQGALSNTVGGVMLLATHPFAAGDYVEIGAIGGTVLEVGLTYTKLVTPDNKVISIPNSTATTQEITNFSASGSRRVEFFVSASYDSPAAAVKQALLEAAAVEAVLPEPAPFVGVQSYDDSAIAYVLRIWCQSQDYWDVYYAVNERIKEQFDEAGIVMTYPHLNVHLDRMG